MKIYLRISNSHFHFACRGRETKIPFDINDCTLDAKMCKLMFSDELRSGGHAFLKSIHLDFWDRLTRMFANDVFVLFETDDIDDLLIRSIEDYATCILMGRRVYCQLYEVYLETDSMEPNLIKAKHSAIFKHLVKEYRKTGDEKFLIRSAHFPVEQLHTTGE